ncbi:MAG TPA: tyrosine--tRNA ligase [Acidimicrobiaceae bacterium]|nr:tyrosine--tRNA ligase [Acidimicrobiaceae bacterium]
MTTDVLAEFEARGLIQDTTEREALAEALSDEMITVYVGFDPTADSLHLGNLIPIMALRRMQLAGHKPIALVGGSTGMVGDPGGRSEERNLLDTETLAHNVEGISAVLRRFLDFDSGAANTAEMVNNYDWTGPVGVIDFLRDVGKHVTVNQMMAKDSVKSRLESENGISFTEFSYMLLQANDYLWLHDNLGCSIQIGGSDQWGNIINGVELGRRTDQRNIYGLTTPLLTTSSGAKMGKTAAGAIWLNADMLSPYDYWQYWRNTEDADVGKFLRLFTDLPLDEITDLEKAKVEEINDVKKRLATEITKLCHGADAAIEAAETARRTFEEGGLGEALPSIDIPKASLETGIVIFELFKLAGLATSNGEARRLIKGGGGKLNGKKIDDETQIITNLNINSEGVVKLSAGKKRHVIMNPV